MNIIWAPLAIDRISEIANYIALDSPESAEKWADSILKKVDILETSPRSGRKVPEINREEFREIIFGNYRIVYRIEEEQLSILTVGHGKQILPIEEILA